MKHKVTKTAAPPLRKLVEEMNHIEHEITSYRIQIRISKIVIKSPEEYTFFHFML